MKKNPVSYFGWLGLIGIIGINTGDFLLQTFLVYLLFFLYRNIPMDELFLLDVRKAGFRAFLVNLLLNSFMVVWLAVIERGARTARTPVMVVRMFALVYVVTFLVFLFTLFYYQKREKRSLE